MDDVVRCLCVCVNDVRLRVEPCVCVDDVVRWLCVCVDDVRLRVEPCVCVCVCVWMMWSD